MEHIIKVNHITTLRNNQPKKIRIVNISDIHFGENMKIQKVRRVFTLAEKLNVDYICLSGDNLNTTNVIDSNSKRLEFLDVLEYSGTIAPTMVSLADHDQRYCDLDGHAKFDFRKGFWDEVDTIPNVHVLNNASYEDEYAYFLGYTLPSYYYHAKYDLPGYSRCSKERLDEDVDVLIEDMNLNKSLFRSYIEGDKYSAALFHSPQYIDTDAVATHLKGFDHIFSGHMHEGCIPPILDEIIPGNKGLISPQRTLFPDNARGIIKTSFGSLCIISGGITKIHESSNIVLRPFNRVFPMHIDIVDVLPTSQKARVKEYTRKSYYKFVK